MNFFTKGNGTFTFYNAGGSPYFAMGNAAITASKPMTVTDPTAASSTITGAFQVTGGVGVGGSIYCGSNLVVGTDHSVSSAGGYMVVQGTTDTYLRAGSNSTVYVADDAPGGNGAHVRIGNSSSKRIELGYSTNNRGGCVGITYDSTVAAGYGLVIDNNAGGTTAKDIITFVRAGVVPGNITTTNAATAYNTSSDVRLKTDERPFSGAATIVDQLRVWDFAWRDGGERSVGLFAQEAYDVFPLPVTPPAPVNDNPVDATSLQNDTWFIDYSKFVPLLLADAQETHAHCKQLQDDNDQLRARLATLEQQVAQLLRAAGGTMHAVN
jgi:hypothetical protein